MPKHVVIGGAGCCGLAAGIALLKRGFEVTIFEQDDHVGGLAGGLQIGQNTFEYGPHIFHTVDPEILADVKDIARNVLLPFHKTMKIKFLGKYFDFPLAMADVLFKLPFWTVISAGMSFVYHLVRSKLQPQLYRDNAEVVLRGYYGDVLYRIFFKDYISKVWGIEASQMSPSFARQRIPRLDIVEIVEKVKYIFFKKKQVGVSTENYVEKVEGENYTTKKGFSLIAEAFEDFDSRREK